VLADARAWSSTIKAARARFAQAKAWMAVDVSDKGAKNFRGFDSLVDFLECAEASHGAWYYEQIPEGAPVWLYFDADMKLTSGSLTREALASDLQRSTEQVASAFLRALEDFAGTVWPEPQGLTLIPGRNCQVCSQSKHSA
jgi:hypothetical protein